jgi:hypothetical protein
MKQRHDIIVIALIALVITACTREGHQLSQDISSDFLCTRSIVPDEFDWEVTDWMPTPSGQAQIPMPWGGQGSISGFYGMDVVNDYHKVDGWRMVYSTFRNYGEELIDPYFVLYNIYRGTLRIYFFLTNPYIGESTYLQDILAINHNYGITSNLLNYLANEVVDIKTNVTTHNQIQPKMLNGAAPLAGRRWYMIEYEMAYDPSLTNYTSNQISLSWYLNYYNINEIKLNGSLKGEIYGTIGGSDNFMSDAKSAVANGVLSAIGLGTLEQLTINETTGENKLGLKNNIFKSIVSGIQGAISSSSAAMPNIVMSFLSSIFGGSSESSGEIVSIKSNATISLSGTSSNCGAVSSTPVEFKIPGIRISSNSSGYIPLYDKSLGVLYWKGGATVNITESVRTTMEPDDIMNTGNYKVTYHTAVDNQQDYSQYVIINPTVLEVADVSVESQKVYAMTKESELLEFPLTGVEYANPWESDAPLPEVNNVCIQILLKVQPKDGSSATYITKTFYADKFTWTVRKIN